MEEAIKNPPPQAPSTDSIPTKKRPLEPDSVCPSSFKLRVILRDLRPHFLEVLRTDDFRSSKASNEIGGQMKILVGLYNQTTTTTESHTLPVENKTPENLPPSGNNPKPSSMGEKLAADPELGKGTYIIGGSAFGWNYVTFSGLDPVYYGVTKETFRANNDMTTRTTIVTPVEEK